MGILAATSGVFSLICAKGLNYLHAITEIKIGCQPVISTILITWARKERCEFGSYTLAMGCICFDVLCSSKDNGKKMIYDEASKI